MSGPNGDPTISIDDGIINDEDEFDEEGNETPSFIANNTTNVTGGEYCKRGCRIKPKFSTFAINVKCLNCSEAETLMLNVED